METLPDLLEPDLDILSIGINPSIYSVERGFYFARPQNRFWKALNGSRLVPEPLVPGIEAMRTLLERDRIGFTDVVKRPTPMARELAKEDWFSGARELREKIARFAPRVLWFHGKTALGGYLRGNGGPKIELDLGRLPERIEGRIVFVTPSSSPANAACSLAELTRRYDELAELRSVLRGVG